MIGPRHPYGPNNNEVMFNVLGFECKPKEDIYKNTGHFFWKNIDFYYWKPNESFSPNL